MFHCRSENGDSSSQPDSLGAANLVLVTVAVIGGSFTGVTAAIADEIRGGWRRARKRFGASRRPAAQLRDRNRDRREPPRPKKGAGAEGSGTTRAATETGKSIGTNIKISSSSSPSTKTRRSTLTTRCLGKALRGWCRS